MSARQDNHFMQDFTVAINKIPRAWNLVGSMGLYTPEYLRTETATVDVVQEKTKTFGDVRRGGPRQFVESETIITKPFSVPFFALDGVLRPTDIQNLRRAGTENDLESEQSARMKIMERIMRYHGSLKEKVMVQGILGTSYAPNGTTQVYNWYTEFGQTQKVVSFGLAGANNPLSKAEEAWGHIIDNAQDGAAGYEVVALCSPEFFSGLVANSFVVDAYNQYQNGAQPTRDRMGGNSIYREFVHGNVRYIEYRGAFNGDKLIPAGDAYFFPVGIADMFTLNFSPADHIDYINTVAQEAYMFEFRDPKGRKLEIESETAMLAVNARPELVVRATAA